MPSIVKQKKVRAFRRTEKERVVRAGSPLVEAIEEVEGKLQSGEKRLDVIERRLRLCDITERERAKLEDEEIKVQGCLVKNKAELRSLRFENCKTMLVSVVIFLFLYGLFYLYTSAPDSELS